MANQSVRSNKKHVNQYTNDNILEQLRSVGSDIAPAITKDLVGQVSTDALGALLGQTPRSGELKPNEDITVTPEVTEQPKVQVRQVERNWESLIQADQAKVAQEIEALRMELKALTASLKNLHQEIVAAVAEAPVRPGVYHLNFYEQLKSFIKILREQIEDSRSWLNAWNGKRKKMGYWGMFKKHGTSFGLSDERAIATSAG